MSDKQKQAEIQGQFLETIPVTACCRATCNKFAVRVIGENIVRKEETGPNDSYSTLLCLVYYCEEHWPNTVTWPHEDPADIPDIPYDPDDLVLDEDIPDDPKQATYGIERVSSDDRDSAKLVPDDLDALYVAGPSYVPPTEPEAWTRVEPSTIESKLHTMSVGQFMDRLIALFPSVNDRYLTPLFMEVLNGGDGRVSIEAGPVVNITRDPERGEVSCIVAGFSSHDEWELAQPKPLWSAYRNPRPTYTLRPYDIIHRDIGTYIRNLEESQANDIVALFNDTQFMNDAKVMREREKEGQS